MYSTSKVYLHRPHLPLLFSYSSSNALPIPLAGTKTLIAFLMILQLISASSFIKGCTISSSHPSCVISNEKTSTQCPGGAWFYLVRAAAGWRTESTWLRVQKPDHRISHINHSVTFPSRTSASLPLKQ